MDDITWKDPTQMIYVTPLGNRTILAIPLFFFVAISLNTLDPTSIAI